MDVAKWRFGNFLNTPKSAFTWEAKWTQTSMRFHFSWKFHFGVQSALYLCSHEWRWNETQNDMDFISVILTEMKFQTVMKFLCEHNLPQTKGISTDLLDVAFNAHVRLKLNAGMDFISVILREMKFHVNRTCFHVGLKSPTSMSDDDDELFLWYGWLTKGV